MTEIGARGSGLGAWVNGRRRVAAVAALLALVAAVLLWYVRRNPEYDDPFVAPDAASIRSALFAELQPVPLSNCELRRFGEPNDGGYLMCANLLGSVRAGYSYGINGYDQWGCDVSRALRVPVHQYDCFNVARPACAAGTTVFHAECVGASPSKDDAGRIFDTIARQLQANGNAADRLVVKMDVEGAEWDTLLTAPADVLDRIDQLVLEFHGVNQRKFVSVVRRLKRYFHVVHVHHNNYACQSGLEPFPSWAYEVLFVTRRLGVAAGSPAPPALHPLDAPNTRDRPDCQPR